MDLRHKAPQAFGTLAFALSARPNASGYCQHCERHTFWIARMPALYCLGCGHHPQAAAAPAPPATPRRSLRAAVSSLLPFSGDSYARYRKLLRLGLQLPQHLP
ncbi:MAG: hypothetical protein R3247_04505 [Rhodothermales bacterium]|nr:hypothetical protein [Rhodothermales bacterium]